MYYTIRKYVLLGLLLIVGSSLTAFAQSSGDGYNPDNPKEPGSPSTLMNYSVAVRSNLDGAGTVTGAGVYKYGTNVTIKATANTGYKFLYWQKGDAVESFNTNAQFTYTVQAENVQFTAVYEKLKTITVARSNDAAGTVTGGGSFQKGNTVTLTATANKYYEFLYWKKGDSDAPFSTDATCTYTVEDDDVAFTAVYKCPPVVTLACNDNAAGTVKYEFSYNVVSGEYVPPKDYIVGTGTSTSNTLPFGNYYKYSTTQSIYRSSEIGGDGKIYSIAYYVNNTASYTCNVKIYMGHRSSSTFSSGSNFTPIKDLTLVYSKNVTIGRAAGWENYVLDTPFDYNGKDNLVVVVTHTASSCSSNPTYRYSSVSNSCLYRQSDSSSAYGDASNTTSYKTSSNRPNAKFNKDINTIVYGTDIIANVSATPATKYRLVHWLKNDDTEPYTTEPSFEYPLGEEDVKFTAVFRWNPDNPAEPNDLERMTKHNVTVGINDEAAGVVAGAGRYLCDKSVTISTSANAGYRFLHWLKDDDETPYKTTASFTYTMGIEDVSFTAVYEVIPPEPEPVIPDKHILYVVPETMGSCTFNITSGKSIEEGEAFSVTVNPGPEQQFLGWYQNGVLVATTLTYVSYMGTEDIKLVAKCKYVPESPDEPNNPGGFIPELEGHAPVGDVNGDGEVTVADAVAVLDYYLNWTAPSDEDRKYDVNEDGMVSVADVVTILEIYLNKQ